jgi:hypothetical protein
VDLASALQDTIDILKRKEAIKQALDMDLIDVDEAKRMSEKLVFEYHVLRDIYMLPAQEPEIPEPSQAGA